MGYVAMVYSAPRNKAYSQDIRMAYQWIHRMESN
jgi:hypothetical protein